MAAGGATPTRGSISENARSRPDANANADSETSQRAIHESGRKSRARSDIHEGLSAATATSAAVSTVHGRKARTSIGVFARKPGSATTAGLVQDPEHEPGRRPDQGSGPEAAATVADVRDEVEDRGRRCETDERGEGADHRGTLYPDAWWVKRARLS